MNAADAEIAAAVAREIPRIAAAVDAIAARLERGGHLTYIGAGTSGRLGVLDAVGVSADLQCPSGSGARDYRGRGKGAQPGDGGDRGRPGGRRPGPARLGIRAGRCAGRDCGQRTDALCAGRGRGGAEDGGADGGISCTPDSELSRAVDFPIEPKPGPEILTGSTRLRAGTATKMVLNMISTGGHDPAGTCVWEPDGERPADQPEAGGSGAADHRGRRRGCRTIGRRSCWKRPGAAYGRRS